MNLLDEILMIGGIVTLPYGLYKIAKGEWDRKAKIVFIMISLTLFIVEFLLMRK